jgi:hypothetical protein
MAVRGRKTQSAEIIAEFLDCDIDELLDMAYQVTVYRSPQVFSWDDNPWCYFCCPTARQKPPKGDFDENGIGWEIAGYSWRPEHKDRPVYGVRYVPAKNRRKPGPDL